jgi:murein DD-endopeptidase MepM/ murein hydrolase activator NlpD
MCLFSPNIIKSETVTELQNKVVTLNDEKDALEAEIASFNEQIAYLENQVKSNETQIAANETEILRQEGFLKDKQPYLEEYLKLTYLNEKKSVLERLAASSSLTDFFNRKRYLDTMQGKFKDIVEQILESKDKLELAKQNIEDAKTQNELAKASIAEQKVEKEKALAQVTEEEAKVRKAFAERLSKFAGTPYCKGSGKVIKARYSVFSFPTDCGYISQGFGMTEFASVDRAYKGAPHNGVDVAVGVGTPVHSIGNGAVYAKGKSPSGGWGNWVMIKLDKVKVGKNMVEFYALYGHMLTESPLKMGEKVNMGKVVGFVGGSPNWPIHLHYSLFASSSGFSGSDWGPYPGNVVDPLDYMDIPISITGTDWDPKFIHY